MNYSQLSKEELQQIYDLQKNEYDNLVSQGYSVDIARGKPCNEQLDIAMPMLNIEGLENMPKSYRNYGMLDGIPELKKIFAQMLGVNTNEVILGGSSSLNLMYDTIQRALQFGIMGAPAWNKTAIKFLCPVPGYDRHFAICEHFGIEMINVPMDEHGPNMDLVEQLVANDDSIKGIWCVPKYSNPTGVTYSDEVVKRLASMKTKAKDFRIFWDNAYVVHDLTDTPDNLANIMELCKEAGTEDRVYQFASTSKVTMAGAGVSCIATSVNNVKDILSHMTMQTISYNKVWQYIHYLFLKDMD
ncbi:MAG: aminotransferase class I/II-fold pyridoxal phosphate-dependent enzyme, partial [Clostridia bacterium]|nr:aminotransferase class I/II-fold pyridoxal phosphate-dependent enzyme [Clostridia bacterium]